MARIRSIHPSQWTDEDFVDCSLPARLLALALRNEADDGGVFEWKPRALKMRLMPADDVDVNGLLQELAGHNIVRRYDLDGKGYGAIRNFCRFQSPKKPREVYPRADWVAAYVGKGSVPVEHESGTGGEPVGNQYPLDKDREKEKEEDKEGESETDRPNGHTKDSAPAGARRKPYAFAGKVIRLTAADLDRWRTSYGAIDVSAQLQSLDDWLASDDASPDHRKRWFHVVSASLAKKHQAALRENQTMTAERKKPPDKANIWEGFASG